MNTVYENPVYLKEIDDCMEELSPILKERPRRGYFIIRNTIEKIITTEKYTSRIQCGSINNCSFCCHDKIMMGKTEAAYIKHIIIEKKIIPNKHRIEQQNNNPNIKWIDKACPMLLDENEKGQRLCSIYNERPLICRTHNSNNDPQDCNKEHDSSKIFQETKAAVIDALSFTAVLLGTKSKHETQDSMVSLHKILAEMDFK